MTTRRRFALAAALTLVAAGCASTAPPGDERAFQGWYRNVQDQLDADPYVKPLPVRGQVATDEYMAQLRAAWRGQVTPEALVTWLIGRYPGQRYEAEFIAQRLPR